MRKTLLLIQALCLLGGLLSCSRSEPRIDYGFIELVYYMGREAIPNERYSFFILPEDDDGVENLSELYLYHDREGLRWHFTSDDWVKYEQDGKTWVGSRNIAMFADAALPRGQYRAVLINKGGYQTESRFTYDGPERSPHPFPSFSVTDGNYSVESQYPINHLVCYDQQGNFVRLVTLGELEGTVSQLRLPNSIRTAALWAEDPEFHISVLTEAAALR